MSCEKDARTQAVTITIIWEPLPINLSWSNVKICKKGSRIANHAWSNNPIIDFENASIIDKGTFRTRKTLEALHTRLTPNTDNNFCLLPGQYNNLFNEHP